MLAPLVRLFLVFNWLLVLGRASPFDWNRIKYVYAFGDSYTFVLGTAGHGNFSFIGDSDNFAFTPQELLRDEIVVNTTSSDGSNWIEFLTGCFVGSPLNCTIQLWDFAFAGSDVDARLTPKHRPFTIPLMDQVRQWVSFASSVIPHPERETLTVWWIGINDCVDPTKNTSTITDFDAYLELDMDSYFASVQLAHDNGLHQHLFMNVPPMEEAPLFNTNETLVAILKDNVDKFNAAVQQRTKEFEARNSDAVVLNFDVHGLFNEMIANGGEFGFNDTTGFCTCDTPGFLWWNTEHPTQATHRQIATAVEEFLSNAP
ncbi:hypothetical protein BDZ89DRAFT_1093987 [Hymenopellis radicata]|nr:hypothetical protein BDZ89DRAFT_1093987 [Hymenopellis radicata]